MVASHDHNETELYVWSCISCKTSNPEIHVTVCTLTFIDIFDWIGMYKLLTIHVNLSWWIVMITCFTLKKILFMFTTSSVMNDDTNYNC